MFSHFRIILGMGITLAFLDCMFVNLSLNTIINNFSPKVQSNG